MNGLSPPYVTTAPRGAGGIGSDGLLDAFVADGTPQADQLEPDSAWPGHFRTRSGDEVDLVMEARDGTVVGIEVTSSVTVRSGDFAGLRALEEIAGPHFRRGVVLYTGTDVVLFGPKVVATPVSRRRHRPLLGSRTQQQSCQSSLGRLCC